MKEILTEWRKFLVEAVPNIGYERKSIQDLYADLEKTTDPATRKYLLNYIDHREKRELLQGQEQAQQIGKRYTGQYGIANAFIDLSNTIKSATGIRVLDPTAPKEPPKWAQKSPVIYAALQTVGELFADDPVSLASNFIPFQAISKASAAKAMINAEKKVLPAALENAAKFAPRGEQAVKTALQDGAKALPAVYAQEAKTAALEIAQKLPANLKKDYGAASLLKIELDKGVLNAKTLEETLRKANPKISSEEIASIFKQFESFRAANVISPEQAVEQYQRLNGTYSGLVKKYGIGIDLEHLSGAYITKVGGGDPAYMKYVYELAETTGNKEIMAASEVNIGAAIQNVEKKGSGLFRKLFHEIGHVEFLKNYKEVAKPFYQEWTAMVRRQIYPRKKQMIDFVNSKFGTQYTFENLSQRDIWRYVMTNLPENEAKWFRNNYTIASRMEAIANKFTTIVEQNIDNPDGLKKIFSEMDVMYGEAQQEIADFLPKKASQRKFELLHPEQGPAVGKIYFLLQPEETFAELFEKTVRGVVGGQTEIASKNFPETIKIMQKYAENAAKGAGMIKESKNRRRKKILYIF